MTPLVDAQTLAAYLGVSVGYVYEHADLLQARRLGTGPKARLRFSIPDVDAALTNDCSDSRRSHATKPHQRTQCPQPGALVPIRRKRTERAA